MSRDLVQERVQFGPRAHRPGRVVRVADVDELRPRPDRLEHRVEVVAVVAERNPPRDGADLERVDHVAREGRPAAHDLVARVERELREVVDDPVGAGSGRDLLEADVVQLGEGRAEPPRAAVRIAVQVAAPRARSPRSRPGKARTAPRSTRASRPARGRARAAPPRPASRARTARDPARHGLKNESAISAKLMLRLYPGRGPSPSRRCSGRR